MTDVTWVNAALAVSGSPLAKTATQRYDCLTLEQAAVLAEFDDDPDTVKALVAAATVSPGQFAHVAQRARDTRDQQQREAAGRTPRNKSPSLGKRRRRKFRAHSSAIAAHTEQASTKFLIALSKKGRTQHHPGEAGFGHVLGSRSGRPAKALADMRLERARTPPTPRNG
jgi:hypothetical protein